MPSPAVLSVDLSALARNFHTLQALTGAPVHPVVKADSYGLGANACATRLMAEGARTFFVARAAEGAALRTTLGSEAVIYVLDGCHDDAAAQLKAADLRPVLNQPRQLRAWREAGGGACGLQIDTGMNRLGIRPEDAPEAFDGLALVLTHLACADEKPLALGDRAFWEVGAAQPAGAQDLPVRSPNEIGPRRREQQRPPRGVRTQLECKVLAAHGLAAEDGAVGRRRPGNVPRL
jgi:alanine racemase